MRFTYIGDHEETECLGLRFPRGVAVEVTDPVAVRKLSGNIDFSMVVDGVEVMADPIRRRGRPPKAK